MTQDKFASYATGPSDIGRHFIAITPADSDLPHVVRAIYVGTGGDVVATGIGDTVAVTFKGVPSGAYLNGMFRRIGAATTASEIVGCL